MGQAVVPHGNGNGGGMGDNQQQMAPVVPRVQHMVPAQQMQRRDTTNEYAALFVALIGKEGQCAPGGGGGACWLAM